MMCSCGHCSFAQHIAPIGLHEPKVCAQNTSSWLLPWCARDAQCCSSPPRKSAASTCATAEGPKPEAGPGSQPAAGAAMPSPAQWAAEGTMHMSVGSAAAMEPFQRMQAASDVAGRSAEADSSAAAVEQPRGGRQGTFRRFGCSTAAQPVALMQRTCAAWTGPSVTCRRSRRAMQRHRQACCDRWSLTGVLFCAKRRCSCVCLHCLCPT